MRQLTTLWEVLYIAGAILGSLGGASIIIIGVSKWFGNFLSKKLLNSYNNQHEKELAEITSNYRQQLEETKTELDKTKSQFLRYSEEQFELYNDIWRVLLQTKRLADELWENPTIEKIPSFVEQIKLTRDSVDDGMLLIESEDYEKIENLIAQFENFQIGKSTLVQLRSIEKEDLESEGITDQDISNVITDNYDLKEDYNNLIREIGDSFRKQLKGG